MRGTRGLLRGRLRVLRQIRDSGCSDRVPVPFLRATGGRRLVLVVWIVWACGGLRFPGGGGCGRLAGWGLAGAGFAGRGLSNRLLFDGTRAVSMLELRGWGNPPPIGAGPCL